MSRLVWQPYMIEGGRIIDGTVFAEPIEDRAVIARIGGNDIRRAMFAAGDPLRCRYQDCGERHPLALPDEQITCRWCREDMGLDPITCRDHPNGCGNILSEAELRALDGNR